MRTRVATSCKNYLWANFEECPNESHHRVIGQVFESEIAETHVSWIGLTKDSVTEPRNDLTRIESRPTSLLHVSRRNFISDVIRFLEFDEPFEDLLVGQSMQRT